MAKCVGADKYFLLSPSENIKENETKRISLGIKSLIKNPEESKIKNPETKRSKTLSFESSLRYHHKLFEEFFVIGPDPETLKKVSIENTDIIKPKKLFQYPNLNPNWYLTN